MATQTDSDFLSQVAERKGRLLRAEADREGSTPTQLALTFDLGRVLIQPTKDALLATPIEERGELPASLVDLNEAEPWWRLIGNPLTAVLKPMKSGPGGDAGSDTFVEIRLRFREESESPRVVLIASAGAAIRVALEV